MSKPILEVIDLTHRFKTDEKPLLHQIHMKIFHGQTVAITGSSGSGKSTLLHLVSGMHNIQSGSVILLGKNLGRLSEEEKCKMRQKDIGIVYQQHHLLPDLNVSENITLPLYQQGLIKGHTEVFEKLITQLGLEKIANKDISILSGGEKQRVSIARALVCMPKILFMDEPTGNLDPQNTNKLLKMIANLQKTCNLTILMVTHDNTIAKSLDKSYCISNGQCIIEKQALAAT